LAGSPETHRSKLIRARQKLVTGPRDCGVETRGPGDSSLIKLFAIDKHKKLLLPDASDRNGVRGHECGK